MRLWSKQAYQTGIMLIVLFQKDSSQFKMKRYKNILVLHIFVNVELDMTALLVAHPPNKLPFQGEIGSFDINHFAVL